MNISIPFCFLLFLVKILVSFTWMHADKHCDSMSLSFFFFS